MFWHTSSSSLSNDCCSDNNCFYTCRNLPCTSSGTVTGIAFLMLTHAQKINWYWDFLIRKHRWISVGGNSTLNQAWMSRQRSIRMKSVWIPSKLNRQRSHLRSIRLGKLSHCNFRYRQRKRWHCQEHTRVWVFSWRLRNPWARNPVVSLWKG